MFYKIKKCQKPEFHENYIFVNLVPSIFTKNCIKIVLVLFQLSAQTHKKNGWERNLMPPQKKNSLERHQVRGQAGPISIGRRMGTSQTTSMIICRRNPLEKELSGENEGMYPHPTARSGLGWHIDFYKKK